MARTHSLLRPTLTFSIGSLTSLALAGGGVFGLHRLLKAQPFFAKLSPVQKAALLSAGALPGAGCELASLVATTWLAAHGTSHSETPKEPKRKPAKAPQDTRTWIEAMTFGSNPPPHHKDDLAYNLHLQQLGLANQQKGQMAFNKFVAAVKDAEHGRLWLDQAIFFSGHLYPATRGEANQGRFSKVIENFIPPHLSADERERIANGKIYLMPAADAKAIKETAENDESHEHPSPAPAALAAFRNKLQRNPGVIGVYMTPDQEIHYEGWIGGALNDKISAGQLTGATDVLLFKPDAQKPTVVNWG